MFANSNHPKKKLHLNLFPPQKVQISNEVNNALIPTPTRKLDSCRVKQAFNKPNISKKFIDPKGNINIEYSNRYLLKIKQPITPGAHAEVYQEQLISPGRNSALELVRKIGTNSVESEIKIYQLIASNKKSAEKAILQPLFNEKNFYDNTLHFPLMRGGNLKNQTTYLFNALNDFNKKGIAIVWLYKQTIKLLEALQHLHSHKFFMKNNKYKGIVHGDIKPDNILINASGDLVLADFGCAYLTSKPAKQIGSIRYSAPEIFANECFTKKAIKNIEKSDIWSLGVTLYYLLTNQFPCFNEPFEDSSRLEIFFLKGNTTFNTKKRFKGDQNPFFKEGLEGHLYRKKWGENFSNSKLAKDAKKAMLRLTNKKYLQFINVNQNRISILYDFSLVMLLP
ncbi:MAG: protein kinase, partial [Rickettsiella sp.]|nr:protein kinase [Rickettsiella sp.]